ncbi:MAG: cytochrome c biogenesis CcdA family protein, partial [Syntrophorhabdaceae bacterium]|nr:cytochrome c biogenesis CcdA family protein [Syntrophorhabdaceae bacterium]
MDIGGFVAFTGGLLSFFSPCVLPLVPSYLIFISGITYEDYIKTNQKKYRKTVLLHAVSFILGFSFIFVFLGIASSLIGRFFVQYQDYIVKLGGVIIVFLGLFYLDIIKIPFLNRQKVFQLNKKPVGVFGSFLIGITFSFGWTPCVGPALSSILMLAWTSDKILQGVYLLSLYSLGMAIPFIICALIFDRIFEFIK